ncbi:MULTISPECIES: tRNA(1)(Val) (adenine(37)-N(6))-methyltransferase TrmN [Brenneria]|uniref:tRNA1(Val) (adenine(37)-N6)-methyltransferase n=1 Tax=Brenneria nigrifluens DSM 30175 = ATCC 13028 TaxID=1121120 RepID=A0A2U1UHD2_9GAMM|nr:MULTISPECIES: methyltransferase [Brenneria]EHD20521.1 tRNA (adenine-N(6)-)-methyltransferase [Brenneria sp. EniD312]PWC21071.1 methyltransferase domain-containing protein [Brenneria nigrifluens DSM 30175 = ATCC 13028]QCR03716.1 methyltransferase domain-containing protein [Brenneria nigrifluens DSM 30175 = ATCC 13028]
MSEQPDDKSTLRRDGFTFKRFFVAHDRCAMKVGTDGILLGAWAPVSDGVQRVLDIGCGSGLIALMLAQRTDDDVRIDAVELDAAAGRQAGENIAASPWSDRMRVQVADIAGFAAASAARYPLIVSNPPYFAPGIACGTAQRSQARYTTTLTHKLLLDCVRRLITPDGLFCVVLPISVAEIFIALAAQQHWFLRQRVDVAEYHARPARRVLLALSLQPGEYRAWQLAIRDADRRYSADFRELTRHFYLFM